MLGSRWCSLCQLGTRGYKVKTLMKILDQEELPRITIPHKMTQKLEIKKSKSAELKSKKRKPVYQGQVVVSCKRKEYNHRKGQPFSDFNPAALASHGWKHYKSAGDHFTLQANQGNPSMRPDEAVPHFTDLGISNELVQGLENMNITKPTSVQVSTIPKFLEGHNVLCAAETGCGKTLAYLLPMLQKMHRVKNLSHENLSNSPYGVVLVPTGELADQVHDVTRILAEPLNLSTRLLCGGRSIGKILGFRNKATCDILIATPGVLRRVMLAKLYSMQRLQTLIIDEADTLLDDSFNKLTTKLLQSMKIQESNPEAGVGTQLGLIGATMPRDLNSILEDIVPMDTLEKVTSSHLHKLMPHIPQKFIRVKPSEKPEQLLKLLKSGSRKNIPTIVFCNKTPTAVFVHHFLEDAGIQHVDLHADLSQLERRGRFEKFQRGDSNLLVCTDVASRGLDTVRAKHVINYEFPSFMADYIHRAGRVGRVASVGTGFVLSFVAHKWEVDLLWKIETAARKTEALHNVNANIKRKLVGRHENKEMANENEDDISQYVNYHHTGL